MNCVMNCIRVATAGLFLAANVNQSFAGAVLEQSAGNVLVNQGHGYVKAASGSYIPSGARLRVSDKRVGKEGLSQEAVLRFDDGCPMTLSVGQVLTIGKDNPCSFAKKLQSIDPAEQAQVLRQPRVAPVLVEDPPILGFNPLYILGGLAIVGIGVGIAVGVNDNGNGNNNFVSP